MLNNLLSLLKDSSFRTVVAKHLSKSPETQGERSLFMNWCNKSVEDLSHQRYVLPILGVQGCGKSSFINALLFDDVILPVDADETTCIPTEVSYWDGDSPVATVVLNSKDSTQECRDIPCTAKGLREYVHQEYNPGNQKGVARIEIRLRHPLLKNGLVLVDLPGVGSITKANQETTMNYLKTATGAIFVIRCVPPITNSEANFIQVAWPLMGNVFFVQNCWTDESQDEITDGREHNTTVLKSVAAKGKLSVSDISIDCVCVKKALDSAVTDNIALLAESKLPDFERRIDDFAHQWQRELLMNKQNQIKYDIVECRKRIAERIQGMSADSSKIREQLRTEKEQSEQQFEEKRKRLKECIKELNEKADNIKEVMEKQCQHEAEELRNNVRSVIDGGVVGGPQLNKAFNDYLTEARENLTTTIQPEIGSLCQVIDQYIGKLAAEPGKDTSIEIAVNFAEQSKVHEHYGRGGLVAGAVGGGIAGVKLGALAGAAVGGPVGALAGVLVGVTVGILGTLLGSFFGGKAKEIHLDQQKDEARRQLFKYIDAFQSQAEEEYRKLLRNFTRDLKTQLGEWLNTQESNKNAELQQREKDASKSTEEKVQEIEILKHDDEILISFSTQIAEVRS